MFLKLTETGKRFYKMLYPFPYLKGVLFFLQQTNKTKSVLSV